MPDSDFDRVLDECADRLNRGEPMEACLADYPRHAAELKPLLEVITETRTAYSFTPSSKTKSSFKQRFYSAMEKQKRPSLWQSFFTNRLALTATAAVVVIAVAGFLAMRSSVFQPQIPTIVVQAPDAAGNFAFLVSDEVNALDEFSDLMVTIDKVSLMLSGNSSRWIEFIPEVREFDLKLLPGDVTQELWRGNVPAGEYTKVVIYVSTVRGTLESSGEVLEIKLPSSKLQMDLPFEVGMVDVTTFTYDLTVIKTGSARNTKYLLKPQIAESGANRPSVPVTFPTPAHYQTGPAPLIPDSFTHNQTPAQVMEAPPQKARGNPQK